MKSIDKIPTSKIQRASKILQTGAKVGINYLKYYGDRITQSEEEAKSALNESNASDIYDGLKNLKGSALKVAQMLSMEKSLLPQAYVEKFSLAQFSVPPLSAPLVIKTFKQYFGKGPEALFDSFDAKASFAASIGQVHKASLKGKELAVKIQYPGVAQSISSDLAMVKPIALKMFNIQSKGSEQYFKEVEQKLLEETDYVRELEQGTAVSEACSHIPNIIFPKYYPALSTNRIITMDWMEGLHLSEFTAQNTDPVLATQVGQALWDFYMFQIHQLKKVHADPHPGNFLVNKSGQLIALDFGCMKTIPLEFYTPYFELANPEIRNNPASFEAKMYELEILKPTDSPKEKEFFLGFFYEILNLFTKPIQAEVFDFSDADFFKAIADLSNQYTQDNSLRKMDNNRGSKHFIYINRTFFGLYNLMFDLKAKDVQIKNYLKYV